MLFEELPIELIFELFEYLHAFDIFCAFHGLNQRFERYLLLFPTYRVDFRQTTKTEFLHFSQQYLPLIHSRIVSWNVSDDDDTPNISSLLLKNPLYLDGCQHLQSLSLHAIDSTSVVIRILEQCDQLEKLTLSQCQLTPNQTLILQRIWNLPKLHSCTLDTLNLSGRSFAQLSTVAPSMLRLSLKNITCDLQDAVAIAEHTPHLRRLAIAVVCEDESEPMSLPSLPHLTTLHLSFTGPSRLLSSFFQHLSPLKSLQLRTERMVFNGDQWEQFIRDYVPLLRNFTLAMSFRLNPEQKRSKILDKFLSTFQTNFWLVDHQWFVRLDWNPSSHQSVAFLYTIPYGFDEFRFLNGLQCKSIVKRTKMDGLYDGVTHLRYCNGLSTSSANFIGHFSNVHHLEIVLPCSGSFLSLIPSLNQLHSIDVTMLDDKTVIQQLQTILDRAPRLQILTFSALFDFNVLLFQLKIPSLRRLDCFTKDSLIYSWYLNYEQCILLANSALEQQCRTLAISLQQRGLVLELINRMPLLQALTFQCQDDSSYRTALSEGKTDTFLQWLQEKLPPTCLCSRRIDHPPIIHVWIR